MKSKRSIVKHFSLFPNLYRLNLSSVYLTGKLTVLSQLSQSLTVINLRYKKIFIIINLIDIYQFILLVTTISMA